MLHFIIPLSFCIVFFSVYKFMVYYAKRKQIRKIIKEACKRWEKEDVLTEYHENDYKPLWRKIA